MKRSVAAAYVLFRAETYDERSEHHSEVYDVLVDVARAIASGEAEEAHNRGAFDDLVQLVQRIRGMWGGP